MFFAHRMIADHDVFHLLEYPLPETGSGRGGEETSCCRLEGDFKVVSHTNYGLVRDQLCTFLGDWPLPNLPHK